MLLGVEDGQTAVTRNSFDLMRAAMLVCAAGDCHGELNALYSMIEQLEGDVGREVELVLQVGDFGVWSDPTDIDRAAQNHEGAGDFPEWNLEQRPVPRPTVFVPGNHEDYSFLAECSSNELLPGLTVLRWGETATFRGTDMELRIGGVGGCYSPVDYPRTDRLTGIHRSHYLSSEVRQLAMNASVGLDILMLHDAPAGQILDMRDLGEKPWRRISVSAGLAELIAESRPTICLTGHVHMRSERTVNGIRTVGLNKISHPGSLLLLEFLPSGEVRDVAEWGGFPQGQRSPDVIVERTYESLIPDIAAKLLQWASQAHHQAKLTREERKAVHEQLDQYKWGKPLMTVLKGGDVAMAIRKHVAPQDLPKLLEACCNNGLPHLDLLF